MTVAGDRYEDGRPELDAERVLEALRWTWGDVCEIRVEQDTGLWLARRLDGLGIIEEDGPDELLAAIREDWLLRPGKAAQ